MSPPTLLSTRGAILSTVREGGRPAPRVRAPPPRRGVGVLPISSTRRAPPPPAGLRRIFMDALIDLGASRRRRVIEKFYAAPCSAAGQAELLAETFTLREDGSPRAFTKADYVTTMAAAYASAPDWTWAAATDGLTDEDGWSIVELQPSGHFLGAPYTPPSHPDWATLQPHGRRFVLAPETVKVRVEGGKVAQIVTLPVRGGGPRGLYDALGGKVPR